MGRTLEYHNFSLDGDPRWASASRWTKRAPVLVLVIFVLSVIDTVLGAVWIAQLKGDMTVPKILQPLILPGLAFFNAIPSLHLHMLARANPPILALWFSSIFAAMFFCSTMIYLVSCNLPAHVTPLSLRQAECSTSTAGVRYGPNVGMWWVCVLFGLVFTGLYATHAYMAWFVKRNETTMMEGMEEGTVIRMQTADEQQKARDRWREVAAGKTTAW